MYAFKSGDGVHKSSAGSHVFVHMTNFLHNPIVYSVAHILYGVALSDSVEIHSEKFKMNRNGNSILSENICDLLLV